MTTKTNGTKRRSNGHATVGRLGGLGSVLRRNRLKKTAKQITHAAHNAREKFVDVEQTVQKYAKTNPWKTMGISVLAGMVVGRILNNRK